MFMALVNDGPMPTLNWIGKEAVHQTPRGRMPYRFLSYVISTHLTPPTTIIVATRQAFWTNCEATSDRVASFLMDRTTLDAHAPDSGEARTSPSGVELAPIGRPRRKPLYNDLRDNRIQVGLQLEQGHIGYPLAGSSP